MTDEPPPVEDWMKASQTWYREAQRLLAENERSRAALQHIHDYPQGWKHGPSVREFIRDTLDQEEQP